MTEDNLFRRRYKTSANRWSSHIAEQNASNRDTHRTLNDALVQNIRDISQNLRSDDYYSQLPPLSRYFLTEEPNEKSCHSSPSLVMRTEGTNWPTNALIACAQK
jgi:hypothetical protein